MQHRKLGKTGLQVSEIGFGTEHMPASKEVISEVLAVAVDAGLNYIDILQIDPAGGGAKFWDGFGPIVRKYRDKLILASHWGGGPEYDLGYCRRTFFEALSRVGNDYIDVAIMQMIDEPERQGKWLEESLKDLHRYQGQGYVGYIGGSVGADVLYANIRQ